MSSYQNNGDNDIPDFDHEEQITQFVMNELETCAIVPGKAKEQIETFQEQFRRARMQREEILNPLQIMTDK